MAGCFFYLQPSETPAQRWGKASASALFVARGVQICCADAKPLEMLQLCLMAATVPFGLGVVFVEPAY